MLISADNTTYMETLFTIIILLLTVGVFAYLISTISMILEELNKDNQQYIRDLENINRYMRTRNLNKDMQENIRGVIEQMHKDSKDISIQQKAQEVINKLPHELQDKIKIELNNSVLQKQPFIFHSFSEKTQELIKLKMEEISYMTNEIMFQEYIQGTDINVIFVKEGQVELIYKNKFTQNENKFAEITKGGIVGDISFITGQNQDYFAKSKGFTSVQQIKRTDFIKILKQNKEDYEKFKMIEQQISLNGVSNYFKRQCCICKNIYHTEGQCNLLNYKPNILLTFMKGVYSIEQVRVEFHRTMRKIHSYKIKAAMDSIMREFLEDEDLQSYIQNNEDDQLEYQPSQQNSQLQINEEDTYKSINQSRLNFLNGKKVIQSHITYDTEVPTIQNPTMRQRALTKQDEVIEKKPFQNSQTQQSLSQQVLSPSTQTINFKQNQNQNNSGSSINNSYSVNESGPQYINQNSLISSNIQDQRLYSQATKKSSYYQMSNFQTQQSQFQSQYHPNNNNNNTLYQSDYQHYQLKSSIFQQQNPIKRVNIQYDALQFFLQFEEMRNYKIFFPQNNIKNIFSRYKIYLQKIQQQQQNFHRSTSQKDILQSISLKQNSNLVQSTSKNNHKHEVKKKYGDTKQKSKFALAGHHHNND